MHIYLKKYWSWNRAMHHFGNLETCTKTYQLGGHRMLVIFFRWAWGISYGVNRLIARYAYISQEILVLEQCHAPFWPALCQFSKGCGRSLNLRWHLYIKSVG